MHERAQLCQDPKTEFALLRKSLGVSRINHILRVHGHTVLQERQAAQIFDEIGQRSLKRLSEDSFEQATLSAGQSLGARGRGTLPAQHTLEHSAKLRILDMNQDAATAGLIPNQPLVARLDAIIEAPTAVFLEAFDDSEKRQLCCICKSSPGSRRVLAANHGHTVQPSRIQQWQRLNRAALPHSAALAAV